MTKIKAAFIHLTLSVFVIGLLFLIIYTIWYPHPLFAISGVFEMMKLLLLVDVIIGPMLTFFIYKQGKKSLKFDLSSIAVLQLVALIYGGYTIYQGRPSLLVFNNGSFHYLIEKYATNAELKYSELRPNLFSQPKLAYANDAYLDLYAAYAEFEPLIDYEAILKPTALSVTNILAKFTAKEQAINAIIENRDADDTVFFPLYYNDSIFYVAYAIGDHKIIDYLKF